MLSEDGRSDPAAAPLGFVVRTGPRAGERCVVRNDVAHLDPECLWGAVTPLPGAKGRGAAGRLKLSRLDGSGHEHDLASFARTARRGGALRHVLPSEGFLRADRVFDELAILAHLHRRGVPVAVPVAALARPVAVPGLYRLRLVTEELPGVLPLPAFVSAHPERRREAVFAAGALVARAFREGLEHPDLHPDNLVATDANTGEVRVWLLDLDRARLCDGPARPERVDAMLLRMARYMHRHAPRLPVRLARTDVLRFLAGVGHGRDARRALLTRLGPAFARILARHKLSWLGSQASSGDAVQHPSGA